MKKNRKKHDPLNYYANRAEADAVEAERLSKALGAISDVSIPLHFNIPSFSFDGGHRGGAQAHRAGTVGRSIYGPGDGASAGTGAGMSLEEFSGIEQMIEPNLEQAGFAVGVVRGVRSFNVDKLGRLRGISYSQIWVPGENEAECRAQAVDLYQATQQRLSYYFDSINVNGGVYVPTQRWITGTNEAEARESSKAHSLSDCKHGFYAYYDGSNDYRDADRVSAVIEGYGETVIGTRGFRCMKARIVALQIPETVKPHIARMVARNYPAVPILETFEQMVSEFPPDSAGNELTPDTDPDFWTRRA